MLFFQMKKVWSGYFICLAVRKFSLVLFPFLFDLISSNSVTGYVEQGLWLRLLKLGATDDPLSSFEYGTILGMLHDGYLFLL